MEKNRVLIVDDEADIRELLSLTLQRMGLDTDCAAGEFEATQLMLKHGYDLCLTDMRLPDGDGLKLLEHVSHHYANTPVAVITAYGSAENAVAALKAGAFDYLAKPVSLNQLRALVLSALKLPQVNQPRRGGDKDADTSAFPVLLGNSTVMQQTRQMIDKLARSQAPVHISGESGSGKELAARLMHLKGPRRDAPFVPVNCGAIPENLMESEFFGYKKGAFTGADQDRDGFFQAASGAPCFSTRSPTCRFRCRSNCCARSRRKRYARSAQPVKKMSTCALSARPTAILPTPSGMASFARTCTID